jgi:hypothetical protein
MPDETPRRRGRQWLNPESANWLKQNWDLYGPPEAQADLIAGGPDTPKAEAQERVNGIMSGVAGHLMPEEVKAELRRRGLEVPEPDGEWPSRQTRSDHHG